MLDDQVLVTGVGGYFIKWVIEYCVTIDVFLREGFVASVHFVKDLFRNCYDFTK